MFEEVKKIIFETKKASASFLQRRLRIGYSRAARLIDMLEEKGIVGPADGAKPREVYADKADISNVQLVPGGGKDESDEIPKEGAQEEGWEKV